MTDDDFLDPGGDSTDETTHSRWWYGVVIPAVLVLLGSATARIGSVVGLFADGGGALALLFIVLTLLLGLLMTPVFAISLFLDARKIRSADVPWDPNPYVWGLAGVAPIVGLVFGTFSLMIPIALVYLYRRNDHVGLRSELSLVATDPF
jgi:hypothetical protein